MSKDTSLDKKPYKVYIIFHGLWGYESRKDRIVAHTPFEMEHIVCAGYVERKGDMLTLISKPLYSGEAGLAGVTYGKTTSFDKKLNVWVANAEFDPSLAYKRFGTVDLGKPIEILSLRRIPVGPSPKYPFAGIKGETLHPKTVSMIQVFVYSTTEPEKVAVTSSDAKPHIDHKLRISKLHVYAESDGMMDPFHSRDAYTGLAQMFDLDIVPIAPLFIQYADPHVEGLTADDMRSLDEIGGMTSMGIGSKGSNCDALVIDNTKVKSK